MTRDERFVLDPSARRIAAGLVAVGLVAAAIGMFGDPDRTWSDLLVGGFYVMAIALAGAVFMSIQYLSGASWSAGIRRIPEAMMSALPIAAVLMLGLFFGRDWLYPSASGAEPMPASKALYLGAPFFFGRMALFVALWCGFGRLMRQASLRQDREPGSVDHGRLVRYSAIFTVVFAVSFSIASFDWLMSRVPGWSSTIFAINVFAGLFVQGIAAITLAVVLLRERGYLEGVVNENHLHDLGKLMFAFSIFWAYTWFSQYLLIWYGNIPEEITYYVSRTGESWIALFILNVVVNWAIPFLALMTRASKRHPVVLKWVAIVILAGRWLDLHLIVMPEAATAPGIRALDVLIVAGYAGLFFLAAARSLAGAPLVPLNDPGLRESLAHRQ